MLNLSLETWNSLLREIRRKNSGTLKDLEEIAKNFVGETKVKATIKALLYLDFIQLGMDVNKNTTWKATSILEEEVEN